MVIKNEKNIGGQPLCYKELKDIMEYKERNKSMFKDLGANIF
jgi:hypothetical protein